MGRFMVEIDALNTSAVDVQSRGDDVANSYRQASRRISAAGSGWRGNSANALRDRVTAWESRSAMFDDDIARQSTGMSNGAIHFAAQDAESAAELKRVYDGGVAPD